MEEIMTTPSNTDNPSMGSELEPQDVYRERVIPVRTTTQEIIREGPDMTGGIQQSQSSTDKDWVASFNRYRETTRQPNAESSSAAYSWETCPTLHKQYIDVIYDKWYEAKAAHNLLHLKTVPLNSSGDTALHLAVSFNRTSFFEGLVSLMSPEELAIPNDDGNTAFCIAANSGNFGFAQTMLEKNPGLAMIRGLNGKLPIHMAALGGHWRMLWHLLRATNFDIIDFEEIVELFFTVLYNSIYDVAFEMLEKFPELAAHRDVDGLSALHVLARTPTEEFSRREFNAHKVRYSLIERLWTSMKFMTSSKSYKLMTEPSGLLIDAAQSGNINIFEFFLRSNPELLTHVDSNGRNVFHIAVLYRQKAVLLYMVEIGILKDLLMRTVDNDKNNILHFAGMLPPSERFGSSRPDIQIQTELLWFQEVEKRVPSALKTMRNKDGKTPKDIFNSEHKELIDKGKKAAKDTANYGMLVATIIATIVFAATLTVPGHDVSPVANSYVLQKKGWYIVFILSDAVALFSSSSSIIIFLSVLTSSFREDEFISSLQVRLMFGVTTLFVAITSMVVAFTAACFLIFNHGSTWVACLVASLGFVTVALFVFLLCTLFGDFIRSLYLSRHLFRPTNYYQRLTSLNTLGKNQVKYCWPAYACWQLPQ